MRTPIGVSTFSQLKDIYVLTEDILENLDDSALSQIYSGYNSDVDKLLDSMITEIGNSLYSPKGPIVQQNLNYLEKLSSGIDEMLKFLVFNYFTLTVLPDFEMNWHHIEWGNLLQTYQNLGIIAARDHSKSYTFSKAYPLWKLYRYRRAGNPNFTSKVSKDLSYSRSGVLIASDYTLGETLLGFVKEEIEDNPILKDVLYPTGNETWGKSQLKTKNGSTIRIKSAEGRLRGLHPTYIIIDDFLTDSVIYSSKARKSYNDIFFSIIMNMIVPGGQIIVVGTPFHEEDLYETLKTKSSWKVFTYPAIFPNGELLWENRYDYKSLLRKREELGSLIFSREILCKPVSSESSIFPYSIVKQAYIGMENYTLVPNIYSFPRKFEKVVVGSDFAISSSVGSDATSFVVIGVEQNIYWLIHIFLGKGLTYDQQMAILKNINYSFHPDYIMIETNQFQKIFYQMCMDAGLPVLAHNTGIDKYSLTEGLPALAVLFEQNRVRIPRGDQKSIDLTDILASELSSYAFDDSSNSIVSVLGHGDIAMALWQGIRAAQYKGSGFNFDFI